MKKTLLLLCALLTFIGGAWAQLTSISDGTLASLAFQRVDNGASGWIDGNFKNNGATSETACVLKFEATGESNTYYIVDVATGNYVYASQTGKSSSSTDSRLAKGGTSLPSATEGEQVDNLNAYKWVIHFNESVEGKSYGTNVWDIAPYQNTTLRLALWSQTAGSGNNIILYDSGYNIAYFKLYTPSIGILINLNCTVAQIKSQGYTCDEIAEYYKPEKLDVAGWPTTVAYNTFKTAINALDDADVVLTAYLTPYQAMCNTIMLPEVGKFYTIYQPVAGKYIHAVTPDNSTALAASTDGAAAAAIFYIPYSGRFLSYLNGFAIASNHIYSGYYGSGGYNTCTIDHISNHPIGTARIKSGGYWLYATSGGATVEPSSYGAETSKYWEFKEVTSLPVTISAAGYATFCSPVAVTIPEGVTAYVGTLDHGDYLHLEAIEGGIIPANEGVILKGAEGTYNFTLTEGGSAAGNLLTGTVAAIARPADSYVLSGGDYGLGFYKDGAETIPGFKAYLQGTAGVKGFLGFIFDDADAIENIVKQIPTNDEYYDLSGRRVSKPTKGMYIINGKKVLVK